MAKNGGGSPSSTIQKTLAEFMSQAGKAVRHPIGVPDDYTVKTESPDYSGKGPKGRAGRPTGKTITTTRNPYYHDGFQYKPASWSPEDRYQLQLALIQAGLLDPNDYAPSQWDQASAKAFEALLAEANRGAGRWRDTLAYRLDLAAQGLIPTKGARERQPLTVQLTNEADIKSTLDKAAPDMLGRKFNDGEQQMFVKQYHDLETQAQTQAYNMAETGGTVTAPPDVSSFIEQQVKQKYGQEYEANTIGENGLHFLQMLSQSAGSVGLPGVQS